MREKPKPKQKETGMNYEEHKQQKPTSHSDQKWLTDQEDMYRELEILEALRCMGISNNELIKLGVEI